MRYQSPEPPRKEEMESQYVHDKISAMELGIHYRAAASFAVYQFGMNVIIRYSASCESYRLVRGGRDSFLRHALQVMYFRSLSIPSDPAARSPNGESSYSGSISIDLPQRVAYCVPRCCVAACRFDLSQQDKENPCSTTLSGPWMMCV